MQSIGNMFRGLIMPAPANRSAGSRSLRGIGRVGIGLVGLFLIVAGCADDGSNGGNNGNNSGGKGYVCTNGTPVNAQDATADGIQRCARCNSGYVLSNNACACDTSITANCWTSRILRDEIFWDVHYANNTWVVVGGSGVIYDSTNDGVTWTSRSAGSGQFEAVHYADSRWVAIGRSITYTSADAATWTSRSRGY